ncbi:hypothetical protein HUJ04_008820 [Dendroctonus ponderosae]|nr:hypothetical protein HUJ04_008820 [Dendroctonus ponderosae]
MCTIHKTVHSIDNFPLSNHKMLKICSNPKTNRKQSRIPFSRPRRRSRSNSPCQERPAVICRALSANSNNSGRQCCPAPHYYCKVESRTTGQPSHAQIHNVSVEKAISCPEKICGLANAARKEQCKFSSKSTVQVKQFAQTLIDTDLVVNELKGEIQRVKHQLHHMSQQRITQEGQDRMLKAPPPTPVDREDSLLSKLKIENKKFESFFQYSFFNYELKRDLDAKRNIIEKLKNDLAKARDILCDYEKKVSLLHVQTVRSNKAMKKSKENFYACLKEQEEKINFLNDSNGLLEMAVKEKASLLSEKEQQNSILRNSLESLRKDFDETASKCSALESENRRCSQSIDVLRGSLLTITSEVGLSKEFNQTLEEKINDLSDICNRVAAKSSQQKGAYETAIEKKEAEQLMMTNQISDLSMQLKNQQTCFGNLECKCQELQEKLSHFKEYPEKCKVLEEKCKSAYKNLLISEQEFQKEKMDMEKLIEELMEIVKENKVTLSQMSDINVQQKIIIKEQNVALISQEEQIKLIEKQSESFKMKSQQMEHEVLELKKNYSEPCSKEACLCISKELEEIKNALNVEKDTQLLKEKIIEDQSQTIINLQTQVNEKMFELNKAQSETKNLEIEINTINDKLLKKHEELDIEIDQKENLMERLRELECQRNQLSEEIEDFEGMLRTFKENCGDKEEQRKILRSLEEEISNQKKQWDIQKMTLGKEKRKAVCVAKFATQKLLDTVEDFQRQVGAQKKVQHLLTRMLHEKDEQLCLVTSKISSINSITKQVPNLESSELTMKELFFHNSLIAASASDVNTNTSRYSSCSSGSLNGTMNGTNPSPNNKADEVRPHSYPSEKTKETNGKCLYGNNNGSVQIRLDEQPLSHTQTISLMTTVPQNIACRSLGDKHTPTRNSLRHSRMIVMNRNGRIPKKYLPFVIKHFKLVKTMKVLTIVIGIVMCMISAWLALWSPTLNAIDFPYWSAAPVFCSGVVGCFFLGFCPRPYPGRTLACHYHITKLISISTTSISIVASAVVLTCCITHLVYLQSASCSPHDKLNTTCVCSLVNTTSIVFNQSYHYEDFTCEEVDCFLKGVIATSLVLNILAIVLEAMYLCVHWITSRKYVYSKVPLTETAQVQER